MANEFKVGDLVKYRHSNLYGIILRDWGWDTVRVMWTRGDYKKPLRGLCWMMQREFPPVDWASTPFPTCDAAKHWIELIQREE